MPSATYEQLLLETLPTRITDDEQYDAILKRLSDLVARARLTKPEEKLMELLGVLVEDYDRRNAMPKAQWPPEERLRFLLDSSGKTPKDLLPIFSQRSHVSEVLNGKRKINVDQARKLGELFAVQPGLFV